MRWAACSFRPYSISLIDAFGWRGAVRLFAAFVIVVMVPLIGWADSRQAHPTWVYIRRAIPAAGSTIVESTGQQRSTKELLRNLNFWIVTLGVGLVVCGAAGVLGNMVPFVISKGFSAARGRRGLVLFLRGQFQQQSSVRDVRRSFGSPPRARVRAAALFTIVRFFFLRFPHLSCSRDRVISAWNRGRRRTASMELSDTAPFRFP